ncbi:MAG: SLBB domain-containing protein [Candidatus Latescibacterota bacterium]|nr:MAG: SLBB domain-containing protein [Candidatus Latescibacterota bacterium]
MRVKNSAKKVGKSMICFVKAACFVLVLALVLGLAADGSWAQLRPGDPGYRFKPGDRISITVPDRPSMNRELIIDEKGVVTFPIAGDIEVVGLTQREIHDKMYQVLHEYYPSLEKQDFSVEAVPGLMVYVTGEVSRPGGYTFTDPPTLWEAIREAGGPTGEAALDAVRVVEDQSKGGASRTVDVLSALEKGSTDKLPVLRGGDTVVILSKDETYIGSLGVNVLGAVENPGFYRLQSDHRDVMSAIIMAGGPTGDASLSKITVVRVQDDRTPITQRVNLEKFLEDGDIAQNPLLLPGDTVNVAEKSRWFRSNFPLFLSLVATTATVILVIDRVRENR